MTGLLRDALVEIRHLRAQLAERTAPIAIIGAGCRFPAGVSDLATFADALRAGVDGVRRVPPDRWDADACYDADPTAPGKIVCKEGAFLEGIDQFDAKFFGIIPPEAEWLDPQQRLLLECTWEALEHAGLAADHLRGSRTGVFTGLMSNDYLVRALREHGVKGIGAYLGTGSAQSATSGRIAYLFDFNGPAISVDTACSSSLVAVHLACRSLQQGECDLALAGGVNVLLTPEPSVNLSKARMISPGGRCRTFDASADGYVRGEGCGVIVLKSLGRAQADGDRILGVIRGSAVNQNGRSNGLTAPSGRAQQRLLEAALQNAGVRAEDVGYVECHGTATPLGDPIEVHALLEVFARGRSADRPLAIGSVKTNFGHLEGAAGICGLLKALLVVREREVFPHLHLENVNPAIRLDGAPVAIPTRRTPWFTGGGPRIAGVSSFGFVGTNAHVLLEAAPPLASASDPAAVAPIAARHVLTVSAKTAPALRALAARHASWLEARPEADAAGVARTLNAGRCHFPHRLAIVVDPAAGRPADWARRLRAAAEAAPATPGTPPTPVAFLFPDEGPPLESIRQLADREPVFRSAWQQCENLRPPASSRGGSAGAATPSLFAFQYALARLWLAWGVRPAFVIGHGPGGYAAACVAGLLEPEDAQRLADLHVRLARECHAGDPAAGAPSPEHGRQLAEFAELLAGVRFGAPRIPMITGVTGTINPDPGPGTPGYWTAQLFSPGRPADAIATAQTEGVRIFLEIGPENSFRAPDATTPGIAAGVRVPSLGPTDDGPPCLATALASLYRAGVEIDWNSRHGRRAGGVIELPPYAFQRRRHWYPKPA